MHVRAQNAAVLIRILVDHVQFEIFEVCPPTSSVTSTSGKLLCSYPGPALQISSDIFSNECFLQELASFLVQMDVDELDSGATTHKAGSIVREVRDSAHPKYISQLLVGILRGFGSLPASVDRITKRIRDEVLWKDAYKPWRRSPLWLVIRVALQTSLDCDVYKTFILFFHAHLLQSCVKRGFPSEILYLMRVKVALRLSKLGPAVSDHVYQAVYDAATETETLLQQRWSDFQASQSISPPWHPDKLDVVRDTEITLKNSFSYIENALSSKPLSYPHKKFKPAHSRRLVEIVNFTCFSDGRLKAAVRSDKRSALADFELAVERHLDSWVDSSQHDDDSSDVIASCVEQYYANAKEIYGGSPEDNSVMLLTIIDLWMALDKLTVQQCPLMACYSPEIPRDFLHPLLLHRSGSLKRALLIERYISRRHEEASCGTSIFSDNATDSSFAVRYFGGSSKLKQLHADINHHAEQQREAKRAELSALNEEWHSLKDEASGLTHTYVDDDDSEGEGNLVHAHYCQKCGKERAADRLKIDVFEWPLPQSTAQAQLVVFELSPPRAFSVWRGITYKILCDIGMPPSASTGNNADRPKLLLDAFSGLKRWALRHEYHRITLGSTTKSFRDQTHYKKVRIPADEHHVFVNNGLSFKIHDRKTGCWAAQPFRGTTIAKFCVPPIPLPSPYAEFHSFVTGTYHTSNEVIAAQGDCLSELSSHEFLAFSGLRSGPRLQWLNITRELSSPSLSFRREEVHTLITQAAWHLGPLSDDVREWHTDLDVPSFGRTLLHELEHLLGRIEFNWLEEVTIRSIGMSDSTLFRLSDGALVLLSLALITSRFLSAVTDQDICQRAYALLRKVRNTAYNWISELDSKLFQTEDEKARNNLGWRLCTLAATCLSTYDVCLEHVSGVLSGASDIAIAVRCAVIVNDNTPSVIRGDDSHYLSRLLNRHSRLLHFLEPFFREAVRTCPSGFDQALTSLWPGFRRQSSSNWHVLSDPNSRWVSCIAEGGQEIHYNLLSGQLLIGGNPLGRLPQEIIQHPTYASVLGTVCYPFFIYYHSRVLTWSVQRVLDVVPADLPGMEFMTQSNVSGYQVCSFDSPYY